MFKLAVFNIQRFNSNREDFFAFISKSYLKFQRVTELSHSVHRGINPPHPSKTPSSLFFAKPSANCPSRFLGNSSYILFFCEPPPLKIGEPP